MINSIFTNYSEDKLHALPVNIATVGNVYNDGISLIFDGEGTETEKHYKCNTSIVFSAGDRVKVSRISGSYVVEYIIGNPKIAT